MATRPSGCRPRLVVATLNRSKGRELVELLGDVPWRITLLADVPGATLPEETGTTYRENALIKARAAAAATGATALADDSGIEVDALDGGPGLYSARWGGEGLDDAGRNALLLERLRGLPPARRTARYRCVIAIVDPDGRERVAEGACEGVIAEGPRGSGGFGYDPIFFHPPLDATLAEVPATAKHRVSHRGIAARAARALLSAAPPRA
ncbi:MAG TPA: RdgB/HAM1 family non-canonical purine NTP pyrophosphatase [Methylomirabilota bacterium]|nr:RdgB/HAM1 family non-canonical purine NTP pyrophosphatase [Methylomirabilota bacterium]